MLATLKTIIPFVLAFTALGLAFIAVRIGLRATPRPDPFSEAFGEMPGFTAEQLRRLAPVPRTSDPLRRSFATRQPTFPSAGLALRPDAGGDGSSFHPDPAAVRITPFRRPRHG